MKRVLLVILTTTLFAIFGTAQAQDYHTETFNFEGSPQGWQQIDADEDGYAWRLSSYYDIDPEYCHSGSDMLVSFSYWGGLVYHPDNYLVCPEMAEYSQFSFWVRTYSSSYPFETYGVAVSTVSNPYDSDFTTIIDWTLGWNDDQWQKKTIDLSNYAGQPIWVAIRHFDCSDQYALCVDDIELTSVWPCEPPTTIFLDDLTTERASLAWDGDAYSYTMQYKQITESTWTTKSDIRYNHCFTNNDLTYGDYEVRVQADCDPGIYATTQFSIKPILSTGTWYGYCYGSDHDNGHYFISFNMQDYNSGQQASLAGPPCIASTYANGFVWYVTNDGVLFKAPLDKKNKVFGTPVTIPLTMKEDDLAKVTGMSYNPLDHQIYYCTSDKLKRFNPSNPTEAYTIATFSSAIDAFAINSEGQAYGIEKSTGKLFRVDLSDASLYLIGNTYLELDYSVYLAFDLETNELFCFNGYYYNYLIDCETGVCLRDPYIDGYYEITHAFMVPEETNTIDEIHLTGFTAPMWGDHPDYSIEVASDAPYRLDRVLWFWTDGTDDGFLYEEDVFNRGDVAYFMRVILSPKDGYSFDEDLTVYYNKDINPFDREKSYVNSSGEYLAYTIDYYVTGLDEQTKLPVVLQPNPAKDKLYLQGIDNETIRVYDNTGRLVMEKLCHGQLDVSDLAPGIYAVAFSGKMMKFVKE